MVQATDFGHLDDFPRLRLSFPKTPSGRQIILSLA